MLDKGLRLVRTIVIVVCVVAVSNKLKKIKPWR